MNKDIYSHKVDDLLNQPNYVGSFNTLNAAIKRRRCVDTREVEAGGDDRQGGVAVGRWAAAPSTLLSTRPCRQRQAALCNDDEGRRTLQVNYTVTSATLGH